MTIPLSDQIQRRLDQGQRAFRRELANTSIDSARRLAAAYQNVLDSLNERLKDLRILAQAEGMTSTALANEAALIRLRDAAKVAFDDLRNVIERESQLMQTSGITSGLANGIRALEASITGGFSQPSVGQMQALINYVDSAPFRSALDGFSEFHSQKIVDITLAGVGSGKHPTKIARAIAGYVKEYPLADALRMTRTVQIWSARQSTHQIYRENSDVVQAWVWTCARDRRTCMSCWAQSGKQFPLTDVLNDHHMGRCAPVPVTTTWADLGFSDGGELAAAISGETLFSEMPEEDQQAAMGRARWMAWKDGLFQFDDLSTTYDDPVYGTMRKAASLDALVGTDVSSTYKRMAAA